VLFYFSIYHAYANRYFVHTRFAADVFHDLHEQVIATSARGRKVLTRVQNIEAALPSLEKAVKNQKSHIHFAYVPGKYPHTSSMSKKIPCARESILLIKCLSVCAQFFDIGFRAVLLN
jgi:hypothetical protein